MAKQKGYSFPTPSVAATILPLPYGCMICGTHPAGPSGMCAICVRGLTAGGMTGLGGTTSIGPSQTLTLASIAQAAAQAAAATHFPRPPDPEPLPRADMQVVDLIGWRVWRITATGYLKSLTAPVVWLPGVPMEAATVEDHGVATNGIHVFKERMGAVLEVESYLDHGDKASSYAVGSVLLWGDVVEHDVGGWGRGFVLALSKRWPEPEAAYRSLARRPGRLDLGGVQLVSVEREGWHGDTTVIVANMIAQHGVKECPCCHVPPIRYDALARCLEFIAGWGRETAFTIHAPRLGAGLAGGDWSVIEALIEKILKDRIVYIYDLPT